MVTTDAEIDASIEDARRFEKYDQRAVDACYSDSVDSIVLHLENGVKLSVPRRLLQGLTEAEPGALNNIELLGRGTGLYWPALDVAHRVSGLLAGVYGSAKWMERLGLGSEADRISA
jgi:predicted TPR repeat methyltransferase